MSDVGGAGRAPQAGASSRPLAAEVFDTLPVAVGLFGVDGSLRHANPVLADLLGGGAVPLVERTLRDVVSGAEGSEIDAALADVLTGRRNAFRCTVEARPVGAGGLSWTVRGHVVPAYGAEGRIAGLVLQVVDFEPVGRVEEAGPTLDAHPPGAPAPTGPAAAPVPATEPEPEAPVERAAPSVSGPPVLPAGLAEVLEEGSDVLLTADAGGRITYGNRAAREVLGAMADDGPVLLEDVFDSSSLTLFRDVIEPQVAATGAWQGELSLRSRLGRPMAVSARVVAHRRPAGERGAMSIFARDITELKSAEKKLRQLATHDYLTGLPNRLLLYDRLELALNRHARYGTPVALMFCDLDGFKPVNDRHGHQVGDAVLTEVADRIHSAVRDTDTAARLGGDEFGVLVEGVDDLDMLTVVAERMITAISEPIRVNGAIVSVGVSVGIAVASDSCRAADSLVAAADAAMYRAKAEGRGRWVLADPEDDESVGAV